MNNIPTEYYYNVPRVQIPFFSKCKQIIHENTLLFIYNQIFVRIISRNVNSITQISQTRRISLKFSLYFLQKKKKKKKSEQSTIHSSQSRRIVKLSQTKGGNYCTDRRVHPLENFVGTKGDEADKSYDRARVVIRPHLPTCSPIIYSTDTCSRNHKFGHR